MVLAERIGRRHFQGPSRRLGLMDDCSFQRLNILQDRSSQLHIPFAGLRQRQGSRRAQQQLCAKPILQALNPFTDGRVGHPQLARSRRKAARIHHGEQDRHIAVPVHICLFFVPLWNRYWSKAMNSLLLFHP
ncbi:hypothetical protein D3C85_1489530 [compost metagenome]